MYFKELLNQEGSTGELELLCYLEGKVEFVEITDEEVWMAMKKMEEGRAQGID